MKNKKFVIFSLMLLLGACGSESTSSSNVNETNKTSSSSSKVVISSSTSSKDNVELELELKVTKIYSEIVKDPSLIKKEIKNIIIKK